MHRNICSIKIKKDFFWRYLKMFYKEVNEKLLDLLFIPGNLAVSSAIFLIDLMSQFQTIESPFFNYVCEKCGLNTLF